MKTLLFLAMLQMLAAPAFFLPPVDYWEDWGPFGECSRSCGGGVTKRMRRCVTQRTDGGSNCIGPEISYRSCNIQDCPMGSKDFREEQCARFDGLDFQGKRYSWLPYYGAENPCELNCVPRGENFFYRHRQAVVDGTPCYPGQKDICVDGACKRIGCDNILESPLQEDPCLQCGGDGQSCYLVKNTFTMRNPPHGYHQMFLIPAGATMLHIRETVATRNYLAIRNQHGEYYLNGHGVVDYARGIPGPGTMLYYQRGLEGDMVPETIIARGPTTEVLVVELVTQEQNLGVEFEYYLPQSHTQEHYLPEDPAQRGYTWSFGSWSACSRECGSGYQSRHVFCAIGNEVFPGHMCASLPRPHSNRTCNVHPCQQLYSWSLGTWSSCSATCGVGTQSRSVWCVSQEVMHPRVVEDSFCTAAGPQPVSLQACNMLPCAEYSISSWSVCSVTCGEGQQTREVVCVGGRGERLQDQDCSSLHRPHDVQPCQKPACHHFIAWHVGHWNLCSRSCGSGVRERQVICSDTELSLYGVEHCNATPKPPTVETCNTQPCHSPQMVPSVQDPRGHNRIWHRFLPYVPGEYSAVPRPEIPERPHGPMDGPHCTRSHYGCCPDRHTPASGPHGQDCPQPLQACARSRYGCCLDGVTAAQGPNRAGCLESRPFSNKARH
ncbi:papilin-like [Megalops cyprinoides]|uniref:papilin-like n=1 Tax=Megalops cyprinoides TaxID=118141 RepID=UPI0018643FF4|nr:papilin-like [Megalops cyprinoides]